MVDYALNELSRHRHYRTSQALWQLPTIRALRIAVADVLSWLAAGMTHEEILSDYQELTEEDFRACLAYAA